MLHAKTLQEIARELRRLEESVEAQRRVVSALEARRLDTAQARRRLSDLCRQLDRFLREHNAHRAAG